MKTHLEYSENQEALEKLLNEVKINIEEKGPDQRWEKRMYLLYVTIERGDQIYGFPFWESQNTCDIMLNKPKKIEKKEYFDSWQKLKKFKVKHPDLKQLQTWCRGAWVTWTEEVENNKQEAAKKKKEAREGFLYSVLSCISSDYYCPDTFEDFCAEFGYEEDSRKALETFQEASKHATELQCIFTEEEIECLPR